jgi:ferredoxin
MPASTTREFTIEFVFPDETVEVAWAGSDEHVLDAARRAGLRLPSLCEQGWDLACAVRVLAGRLDHSDARRYYREDEEAGFALICTASPLSDLRLRTHQSAAMRRHRDRHGLPAPRGT